MVVMEKKKKDKKNKNTKPIACEKKSGSTFKRIVIEILMLVLGAAISFDVYKWKYPYYTMIESDYITNGFGERYGDRHH